MKIKNNIKSSERTPIVFGVDTGLEGNDAKRPYTRASASSKRDVYAR